MSRIANWRSLAERRRQAKSDRVPQRYDIRLVGRFYVQSQAVARTERHRDEARNRVHQATRRSLWFMLIAGSALFHYPVERVAQVLSLY
jgi:hypothetical protein